MEHVGDFGAFAVRIARTLQRRSDKHPDELPVHVLVVHSPAQQTAPSAATGRGASLAMLSLGRAGVPVAETALLPPAGDAAGLAALAERFAQGKCHVLVAPSERLRQGIDLQSLFGSRPYVSHYTAPATGPRRSGASRRPTRRTSP